MTSPVYVVCLRVLCIADVYTAYVAQQGDNIERQKW